MIGPTFAVSTRDTGALFGQASAAQINKALAIGLTKIGVRVKDAAAAEMRSKFDRPTPYTLNALQLKSAEKTQAEPRAYVGFKDRNGSFIPNQADAGAVLAGRRHYLRPQVYGGGRPLKKMEARLRFSVAMSESQYALPGWGAKLDAYGNMNRGDLVKILAYLGGFGEAGGDRNTTSARKANLKTAGTEYFVLKTPRGRLEPGIYRRSGKGGKAVIVQLLKFINRQPQYRPLFDFFSVADRTAAQVAPEIMRDAMGLVLFGSKR